MVDKAAEPILMSLEAYVFVIIAIVIAIGLLFRWLNK
jgi:hypothetical protein